jgi:hypothetical protein
MKAKSNGAVMAYKKDHSGFMSFDFYGQYVKRMIRKKDGIHYFSHIDESCEKH